MKVSVLMDAKKSAANFFELGFEEASQRQQSQVGPVPSGEYDLRVISFTQWTEDINGESYEIPHLILRCGLVGPDSRILTFPFRFSPAMDVERFRTKCQMMLSAIGLKPKDLDDADRLKVHDRDGGPVGKVIRCRIAPNWAPVIHDGDPVTQISYAEAGSDPKSLDSRERWMVPRSADADGIQVTCLHRFRDNYSLIAFL